VTFVLFFNIIFCWSTSKVGATSNEKADKATKSALNKPILRIPIPCVYIRPIINRYIHNKWPHDSNLSVQYVLYQIYHIIPPQSTLPLSFHRRDQILYNRLRIGHTDLTHSYVIDHTDPPRCTNCHTSLTFKHIYRMHLLYSAGTIYLLILKIFSTFQQTYHKFY